MESRLDRPLAEHVKTTGGFRNVMIGTIRDDAPAEVRAEAVRSIRETIALQHTATGKDVVVVPVLISTGSVSREKIPADLDGLPITYTGDALLPHPGMARWVEARVRERGTTTRNPAAPTSRNPVRQVTITMSEFDFVASDSVFDAGVTYRFVLRNIGHIPTSHASWLATTKPAWCCLCACATERLRCAPEWQRVRA